ncbi:unnamed protein product [Protopolystoma xenopodis]|uniref:Uncharacterized protein n=1 Tax=Protopolystoma xenopodis TaxID=117903 RepID=A0A3S5B4N8_9PLAT|nr:unnamed protein product [Protopolystoma xenopodis]
MPTGSWSLMEETVSNIQSEGQFHQQSASGSCLETRFGPGDGQRSRQVEHNLAGETVWTGTTQVEHKVIHCMGNRSYEISRIVPKRCADQKRSFTQGK